MKKTSSIFLAILFIIGTLSVNVSSSESQDLSLGAYTSHMPIRIDSNQDFLRFKRIEGWPGIGTEQNPYVIEGFDINAENHSDAIFIGNVTDYFVVRNCYLHDVYGSDYDYRAGNGIYLLKTENGIIEDNIILNNTNNGIRLYLSNSNTINGNKISNRRYGLFFEKSSNNIISNNNISDNGGDGSFVYYHSNYNTFIGNTFSNNGKGVRIELTMGNVFVNNTMIENGIYIWGNNLINWNSHSIDTSNTVNGKPIYFLKNQNGGTILSDAGQVILVNSKNIVVENQNINNLLVGIEIGYSSNITIRNNTVSNNKHGFFIANSNFNTVSNNTGSNNKWGFYFYGFNYNILSGNKVFNSEIEGIRFSGSSHNTFTCNNVSNSFIGLRVEFSCNNNTITNNTFSNNKNGIHLLNPCKGNCIYHNYFLNNERQAIEFEHEEGGDNNWDNNFPCGGNYWSDYREKYPDAEEINDTGIWDTPYEGDWFIDHYPLMREPYFKVKITSRHSTFIPMIVNENDEVSIEYTIGNTGETGKQSITFFVNNTKEAHESIMLESGEIYHNEFIWNTSNVKVGLYTIEIASEDDEDKALVIVSSRIPGFKMILLIMYWFSLL